MSDYMSCIIFFNIFIQRRVLIKKQKYQEPQQQQHYRKCREICYDDDAVVLVEIQIACITHENIQYYMARLIHV